MIPGCDPQGWQHHNHGAREGLSPWRCPPLAGRQGALKGPLIVAFGECHLPSNSSSWHCLLWGVRWVTSLECCESGQSVLLIYPDLILLAAGSTLRPCCLLKAAHSCQGYWEQEGLTELTPWARSILSAPETRLLKFSHRYYFTSLPVSQIRKQAHWGFAHCPRLRN